MSTPAACWYSEAQRSDGFDDGIQVAALDGDVDVASQAGRKRVVFVHVQKDGDASDHAVLDSRLGEGPCETADDIDELLHVAIIRGDS